MKFINRSNELKIIRDARKSSQNKLYTLLISGNRRIGKTRLVLELFNSKDIYLFVNKGKLSLQLLNEYEEVLKSKKILTEMESLNNWDGFFKVLFTRIKGMVVFDEFQNFQEIDTSIFGLLQKYIDLNENNKGLLLVFLGSNIGLIKRIFEDNKSPLYGRIKRKLSLKPLKLREILHFCQELSIKQPSDIITLYSIFGGYPKYYINIEDERLQGEKIPRILDRFFLSENALLEDEVSNILSLEFGKRKGIYYDILCAIAMGNTQLKDVSSFLNKKQTTLTRQFNELVNYFGFLSNKTQFFGKNKIYFINHPLINFWFSFFYKNFSIYTQRLPVFFENFWKKFNTYMGFRFEEICREITLDMNLRGSLPFTMEKIGTHWGYIRDIERIPYEVDIVGTNIKENKLFAAECKWKEKVNPNQILYQLKEYSSLINWQKEKRKDYFTIFAKSFTKKIKGAACINLNDIINFYTRCK